MWYMGNSSSTASTTASKSTSRSNNQKEIIQEIHSVAQELNETYQGKYLNPEFCSTLALIHNNKLMNYRKQNLDNVALTLGVTVSAPGQKQQLCAAIVKHYTDRITLVSAIQHSLNYCSNRIFALTTGPRCEGYPEIFDEPTCTTSGGRWVGTVIPPDARIADNKQWHDYLAQMQRVYLDTLSRLLDIVKQLRDFDHDVNDESLRILGLEVEQLINGMHKNCKDIYKLMLMAPTFTEGEMLMKQQDKQIAQQEAAARLAALRASKTLPPVKA